MDSEEIDDLLDLWEMAQEEGRPRTVEDICLDCPHLIPDVQAKVDALLSMKQKMQQNPAVAAWQPIPGAEDSIDRWVGADPALANDPSSVKGQILQTSVQTQVFTFYRKGGGGAIYRGEDTNLGRQQAIKVILPQHAVDQEIRKRFENEARVTARLEHPGIIPVYGTGETPDGLPFYTMRFVEDASLDDAIIDFHKNNTKLSVSSPGFRDLLQRFVSVCQTIAYSHSRGVVHRDIKPHNILLGRYGETLVIDWGLARPFKREGRFKVQSEQTLIMGEEKSPASTLSHRSGTLAYMSPQQHDGMLPAPSDDIYSLGATLYKILCGKSPVEAFRDQTESMVREAIVEGKLPPPSRPDTSIPAALLAICRNAMNVEPTQRYRTAEELADDVSRFISGDRVSVYREPWLSRAAKWSSRHLRIAQIVTGSLLTLMIVWAIASLAVTNLAMERQRARVSNLVSSAQNFSRLLGDEIDLRIRILETEVQSPELISLLQKLNDEFEQEGLNGQDLGDLSTDDLVRRFGPLQDWIIQTGQKYDGTAGKQNIEYKALSLFNVSGYQVARYGAGLAGPTQDKNLLQTNLLRTKQQEQNQLGYMSGGASTVGKNYRFRGYFRGSPFDLDLTSQADAKPHQQPFYISSTYLSQTSASYNFQITVPIYAVPVEPATAKEPPAKPKLLGLLGMAIEIGGLGIPENGTVINRREVKLADGRTTKGLILHSGSAAEGLSNISTEELEQIDTVFQQMDATAYGSALLMERPITVGENQGESLQAISPIVIRTRKSTDDSQNRDFMYDTGWVLLTNETQKWEE